MAAVMAYPKNPASTRRAFFAWLNNPHSRGQVVDLDFDNDNNEKPITAEQIDWHECRRWPALATD